MRRLLILVTLALAAACSGTGSSETSTSTPSNQPTTIVSPSSTSGSRPGTLLLPSVADIATILGLEVDQFRERADLSQAFEGTDLGWIDEHLTGQYTGSDQEQFAVIDLARFESVEAAHAFAGPVADELATPSSRTVLDLAGIGDEAYGYVRPITEGGVVSALVVARTGSVVTVIQVQCHGDGIREDWLREMAQLIIDTNTTQRN